MSVRGEAMVAQRRLDSQLKRERVIAAADTRLATGYELSIAGIARHGGVSRKFIYAHPDLRALVEQRAQEALETEQARAAAAGRVTIASLRADAANLKAQNRRLRQQITASSSGSRRRSGARSPKGLTPTATARQSTSALSSRRLVLGCSSSKKRSRTPKRSSRPSARSTAS